MCRKCYRTLPTKSEFPSFQRRKQTSLYVYNKQLRCGSYNGVIKMYIKEKFYFLLIIASTCTNIKILIQEYCTNGYCFGLGSVTHLSKGSDRSPGFIALPTVDCCNTVCYHSPQCFVNSNLNLNPMSLDVDSAVKM